MNEKAVAEFLDVPRRTLGFWCTTGLLRIKGGGVQGKRRDFTGADIMRAWTVHELREQGASLQAIRKAVASLEGLHNVGDWQRQWLVVVEPGDIVWYDKPRDALLRLKDSQGYVIDVADIRRRVERVEGKAVQKQRRRRRAKARA